MAEKHTHFLTFEGKVPADEMERAKLFASEEILAAKNALLAAFKKAGVVYTAVSKIVRPRAIPAAAAAPVAADLPA